MIPGGDTLLKEKAAEPGGPGSVRAGDQAVWAIDHVEGHWDTVMGVGRASVGVRQT